MRGIYDVPSGDVSAFKPSGRAPVVYGPKRPTPRLVVLSLQEHIPSNDHRQLISFLASKSNLTESKTTSTALDALLSSAVQPAAVLLTDTAIVDPENVQLLAALKQYVSRGGNLIFAGPTPSLSAPKLNALFHSFGLTWRTQPEFPSTLFRLNVTASLQLNPKVLPPSLPLEGLFLSAVDPCDSIYSLESPLNVGEARRGAYPANPTSSSTAVASTVYGRGKVGYVGGVCTSAKLHTVVTAMCGLPAVL